MRIMDDLIVYLYFVTKLPEGDIVGVFYLIDKFVHFLLIRCNIIPLVLFVSRQLWDFIKFRFIVKSCKVIMYLWFVKLLESLIQEIKKIILFIS